MRRKMPEREEMGVKKRRGKTAGQKGIWLELTPVVMESLVLVSSSEKPE